MIDRDSRGQLEEKFRLAVDALPSGIVMVDQSGTIVLVNAETEHLFGYAREELIGQPIGMLLPPSLQDQHDRHVANFAAHPFIRRMGADCEVRASRKDGSEIPVAIGFHPVHSPSGLLVLAVVVDASERKRAGSGLQEYAEREQLFIAAVESSEDPIITTKQDATITGWNGAAERLFGYSSKEATGKTIDIIVPEDRREEVRAILERLSRGEHVSHHETERVTKDARRIAVSVSISPIRSPAGQVVGFVTIVRDITERERAEQALRESEERFRTLVQFSFDVYWESDALHRFTRQEFAEGVADAPTPGSEIGKTRWEVPHLEPDEDGWRKHRATLDAHLPFRDFEIARPLPDGRRKYVSVSGLPMFDATGRFLGYRGVGRHITERKLAEQALRESEARLAAAQRIASLGYWERDLDTDRITWADETYRIFGLRSEEEPSLNFARLVQLVHPEDRHLVLEATAQALAGAARYNVEYRVVRPGGEVRFVQSQADVIKDQSGRPRRMLGAAQDITERKRAEESLRAVETELRLIMDSVPALIARLDRDMRFRFVNRAHAEFLEREPAEIIGRTAEEVAEPEGYQVVLPYVRRVLAGERVSFERSRRMRDGTLRWIALNYIPAVAESGEIVGYYGLHVDITERKLAEEGLLESERMARGIVETALDAFVQMDETGTIVVWNPQAEAIFGWSRAEATGRSLASLIVPPAFRERHRASLERFLRTGESTILGKRFEIEALRRDGSQIQVELSVTALRRRHSHVFNGFIRDVTERIRLEQQLQQWQKLEAIGQLTGGIAHDFNNLLTVILGNLELLDRRLADDLSRALSTEARDAAEMGARLTDRLLTIARQQRLETRRINLNDFILSLSEFLRRTIGATIELSTWLEPGLWPTTADPGQIESALINLAINARDAMPKGGKLAIQTMNVSLDGYAVSNVPGLAAGDYVVLAVSDTGHGMTPEVTARAFEPFFTTKGLGKGSGLGLATIYGFARQSGGKVTIYSEVGQGTTVKLYMPRATDGEVEAAARPAEADHLGRGELVLVVEDDENVRRLTVMRLADLGYRVLDVADASRALEVMSSHPDIDLVFSDLVMPGGLSGFDLARRVRDLHPKTKFVLTSGYSSALVHDAAIAQTELHILRKPYRQPELARVLRRVLDGN